MTETLVFDFVTGTVSLRDRDGKMQDVPDVLELTPVGAPAAGDQPTE